jgi:hypothetical protein
MSSIELPAVGAAASAVAAATRPARRPIGFLRIAGGFVLTGFFLALGAAIFPIATVYGFIWWASFN